MLRDLIILNPWHISSQVPANDEEREERTSVAEKGMVGRISFFFLPQSNFTFLSSFHNPLFRGKKDILFYLYGGQNIFFFALIDFCIFSSFHNPLLRGKKDILFYQDGGQNIFFASIDF